MLRSGIYIATLGLALGTAQAQQGAALARLRQSQAPSAADRDAAGRGSSGGRDDTAG